MVILEDEMLASQDLQFAFIKATEGSSHVDKYFESNFREALQTGLRVGAYHFFSYDSSGATQADNFIATVPKITSMLPPVVIMIFGFATSISGRYCPTGAAGLSGSSLTKDYSRAIKAVKSILT
jgi:hypothetical protein